MAAIVRYLSYLCYFSSSLDLFAPISSPYMRSSGRRRSSLFPHSVAAIAFNLAPIPPLGTMASNVSTSPGISNLPGASVALFMQSSMAKNGKGVNRRVGIAHVMCDESSSGKFKTVMHGHSLSDGLCAVKDVIIVHGWEKEK